MQALTVEEIVLPHKELDIITLSAFLTDVLASAIVVLDLIIVALLFVVADLAKVDLVLVAADLDFEAAVSDSAAASSDSAAASSGLEEASSDSVVVDFQDSTVSDVNETPRCKQRGIYFASKIYSVASHGEFNPRTRLN